MKCPCPIYCRYCGRQRSRDVVGHYCKTHNCQWRNGYSTCTLSDKSHDEEAEEDEARRRRKVCELELEKFSPHAVAYASIKCIAAAIRAMQQE